MDRVVMQGIVQVLTSHEELLRIAVRRKAKFEGWLKFELAYYLEEIGMKNVEVESKAWFGRERTDVTFFDGKEPYSLELKTPNSNWRIGGVSSNGRPITKNIQSIIDDAEKLNSPNGIVAFVLFPIPQRDDRWEAYLNRINEETQLGLSRDRNCEVLDVQLDQDNACSLVVCAFRSRRFRNVR